MNLQIVIPCYNEERVLPDAARQLDAVISRLIESGKISTDSRINFVDDGSRDRTWALIEQEAKTRNRVAGIKLSRNRGHQNALLAGMMSVNGDAVITIDADLQDDINAIERMVDEYLQGYDIVYGIRADRSTDSTFKRSTAISFYRLLALLGLELVHNHADFRLMSRRVIEALREYREVNLYLRGIVPLIGFPSTSVKYERKERFAGTVEVYHQADGEISAGWDNFVFHCAVANYHHVWLHHVRRVDSNLRLGTVGDLLHGSCCPRLGIDCSPYVFPRGTPASVPWYHRCIPGQDLRRGQIPTALLY